MQGYMGVYRDRLGCMYTHTHIDRYSERVIERERERYIYI